jgi:hypothetical protein
MHSREPCFRVDSSHVMPLEELACIDESQWAAIEWNLLDQ